jgi:hypothetical protein
MRREGRNGAIERKSSITERTNSAVEMERSYGNVTSDTLCLLAQWQP